MDAGVIVTHRYARWRDALQLGDKTGVLVQSKARKRAAAEAAKARGGSKGLLSAVGITVRDPQVMRGRFAVDVNQGAPGA